MKFKKPTIIVASLLTVGTIGTYVGTTALASAQSSTATVKTAKHEKRTDHRMRLEARLNQAVRDGTITTAQKTAFTAELKTLKTERKTAISKTSTKAERQAERTKLKTELQTWATSANFPLAKIAPHLAS